ncbi:hypothetical protein KDE13_08895 [Campylobacter sp. faydin G-140]|nr:hypothetical protein [Campylobacter anatolicus]MBR8466449.1 hypothetical protein [Campylobacter anatolicus]
MQKFIMKYLSLNIPAILWRSSRHYIALFVAKFNSVMSTILPLKLQSQCP